MIKIKLKDSSLMEFESGVSVYDVAESLGTPIAKAACCGRVDGQIVDLRYKLEHDCVLDICTIDDIDGKKAFWHTSSHILAHAVKRLYPTSMLAIGPATDNGFYYDFDVDTAFTSDDLKIIEVEMMKIVREDLLLKHFVLPPSDALDLMKDELYKKELIDELGDEISFYKQGDFVDLCSGHHLMSTGSIKAIKLLSVTGAYWRGNEKNRMLCRIYGVSFDKASALKEHLALLEEAKKRDHGKLGRELEYFSTSKTVGQGLPIILPNGAKVIQILQRFVEDEEERRGYQLTRTPLMAKSDIYKISGHWDHYYDGMFVFGDKEREEAGEEVLALRPMTCPFQFQVYLNRARSYRDLPIRYNETATLFRNESSGEMHGLIRVRQFTISEGHIVCRPDQVEQEFSDCVELAHYFLNALGLHEDVFYRFSKWDKNNKDKYMGCMENWEDTQNFMRSALDRMRIPYIEVDGEAAFYGPKLDIQIHNVHGKEDTLITIQIDFQLAEAFGMTYMDNDNQKKFPTVIHRTSIGCYERTLALLIEKYAGALPLWLAPLQMIVIPIGDRQHDYAHEIADKCISKGLRIKVDIRSEKMGLKVRDAQLAKIPYMLIVGDNEMESNQVSVRCRKGGNLGAVIVDDFISGALEEVKERGQNSDAGRLGCSRK